MPDFFIGDSVKKLEMEFPIVLYNEEPILFVSGDGKDIYLVFCVEANNGKGSLVFAKTSILALMKFVKGELTLEGVLTFVDEFIDFYTYENDYTSHKHNHLMFSDLSDKMFPKNKRCWSYNSIVGDKIEMAEKEELEGEIKSLYLRYFLGETIY